MNISTREQLMQEVVIAASQKRSGLDGRFTIGIRLIGIVKER